jgi:hypothetical protein
MMDMELAFMGAVASGVATHFITKRSRATRRGDDELRRVADSLTFSAPSELFREYELLVGSRYNEAQLQWACVAGLVALDAVLLGVVATFPGNRSALASAASGLGVVLSWAGLAAYNRLSAYHTRRIEQVVILELAATRLGGVQFKPYSDPAEQVPGASNDLWIRALAMAFAILFGFCAVGLAT